MILLWLFNSVCLFSTLGTPALKPLWPLRTWEHFPMPGERAGGPFLDFVVDFIQRHFQFRTISKQDTLFGGVSIPLQHWCINSIYIHFLTPPFFRILGTPPRLDQPRATTRRRRLDLPAAAPRGKKPWGLVQTCWPLTRWRLVLMHIFGSDWMERPETYAIYLYIYIHYTYYIYIHIYIYIYIYI